MKFSDFLKSDKAVKNAKDLVRLTFGVILILVAVIYLFVANRPSFQEVMILLGYIMSFIAGQHITRNHNA